MGEWRASRRRLTRRAGTRLSRIIPEDRGQAAWLVAYHSDGSVRQWDGATSSESVYTWNDTWTTQHLAQPKAFGAEVTVRISVTDASGTFGVSPTVTLHDYADPPVQLKPTTCTDSSPYWLDGGTLHWCEWSERRVAGRRGEAEG